MAAVLGPATPAMADGDPASDVLPSQDVFYGAYVDLRSKPAAQLPAMLEEARKRGVEMKVAMISDLNDLGTATDFWKKPQDYAKFLAEELAFVYKERLLVVMPNGYGFWDLGQSGLPERRSLRELDPAGGTNQLVASSIAAVRHLAAREGVRLSVPDVKPPADGMSNSMASPSATPGHSPQATATATATPVADEGSGGGSGAILFFSPFAVAGILAVGLIVVRRRRDSDSTQAAPPPQPAPKRPAPPSATLTVPKATAAALGQGLAVPVNVPAAGSVAVTLSASGRLIATGSADADRAGHITIRLPKISKAERFRGKALSLKLTFGDSVVTKTLKVR